MNGIGKHGEFINKWSIMLIVAQFTTQLHLNAITFNLTGLFIAPYGFVLLTAAYALPKLSEQSNQIKCICISPYTNECNSRCFIFSMGKRKKSICSDIYRVAYWTWIRYCSLHHAYSTIDQSLHVLAQVAYWPRWVSSGYRDIWKFIMELADKCIW